MLKIHSIYRTIQGESSYIGFPCTIVRLNGCNFYTPCIYCDTKSAFKDRGIPTSVEDILGKVEYLGVSTILITGGEPLYQGELVCLIEALLKKQYKVNIETNGSLPLNEYIGKNPDLTIIMDVKTPGSGNRDASSSIVKDNLKLLNTWDEVKFVCLSPEDFFWSKNIIEEYNVPNPIISPAIGFIEPKILAVLMLGSGIHARFQVQLHKIIGLE
jgi:7-carboxy-7-deazaguanine synthase